ncbi:MAG: hypothetical protein QG622_2707 [Actinomycetota bacterium]|nr:hypothetical protein [Actinomycetota bacterium]
MSDNRIEALAATFPELRQILGELRSDGLREPSGPDPLLSPALPAGVLDEFLGLAVRECPDANLFGLTLVLPMCVFQRGAGYAALEHALTSRRLPPDHREFVAGRMLGARSVADVVWAHGIVLRAGNTGIYHSFLGRHAAVVVDKCFDQLAAYLLAPGRGPGGYAAACVEIVLRQGVGASWPFVRRWLEWLDAGLFDGPPDDGGAPGATPAPERPAVLYRLLHDNLERPVFTPLRDGTHRHVAELVAKGRTEAVWWHLAAMVEVGYGAAEEAGPVVGPAIDAADDAVRGALAPARSALRLLAAAQRDPREVTLRAAADARAAMGTAGPPPRPPDDLPRSYGLG